MSWLAAYLHELDQGGVEISLRVDFHEGKMRLVPFAVQQLEAVRLSPFDRADEAQVVFRVRLGAGQNVPGPDVDRVVGLVFPCVADEAQHVLAAQWQLLDVAHELSLEGFTVRRGFQFASNLIARDHESEPGSTSGLHRQQGGDLDYQACLLQDLALGSLLYRLTRLHSTRWKVPLAATRFAGFLHHEHLIRIVDQKKGHDVIDCLGDNRSGCFCSDGNPFGFA